MLDPRLLSPLEALFFPSVQNGHLNRALEGTQILHQLGLCLKWICEAPEAWCSKVSFWTAHRKNKRGKSDSTKKSKISRKKQKEKGGTSKHTLAFDQDVVHISLPKNRWKWLLHLSLALGICSDKGLSTIHTLHSSTIKSASNTGNPTIF